MRCKFKDCFSCPYPDCINDEANLAKPLPESTKAKQRAYELARRKRFAQEGLCTMCGKREPLPGKKRCAVCSAYARRKSREYWIRDGKLRREEFDGVTRCFKCGKAPPAEGYKLCPSCLDKARAALDKTPTHNGQKISSAFTGGVNAYWKRRNALSKAGRNKQDPNKEANKKGET